MNTAGGASATKQMASNYYWGMWGTSSRGAAVAATTTTLVRSTCPPTVEQSWEEQAFARDAAGHLGSGCVWPPRSYTCTFCRREFRSAQALGGHMNVHRRDRARLRQCASPPDHQLVQPTTTTPHIPPADYSYSPVAVLLSSPKSSDKDHQQASMIISSTTSPSYISAIIKESKNKVFISMPQAASTARELTAESSHAEEERMRKRRRVVVDLSPPPPPPPPPPPAFFVRPRASSCERIVGDAKVISSPSPAGSLLHLVAAGRQELDLELRLGTSPPHKVA